MYYAKKNNQLELNFSKYSELYDIFIKTDNLWCQFGWFSFIYEELKNKYSPTMGRICGDTVRIFTIKKLF